MPNTPTERRRRVRRLVLATPIAAALALTAIPLVAPATPVHAAETGLPAGVAIPARAGVGLKILAAPAQVVANETAVIDVTARAGSKCRLSLTEGGQTWRTTAAKLAKPASTSLQFAWFQTTGTPSGDMTAVVSCTHKGKRASSAVSVVLVGDGQPGLSAPALSRPAVVSLTPGNPLDGMGGNPGSPPFGTLQVAGSQWLGGGGVDVISNGGSTYDCPGGTCQVYQYGIKFQCVELVNRFVMQKGWSGRIWGNARDIYANAPAASFDKHASAE